MGSHQSLSLDAAAQEAFRSIPTELLSHILTYAADSVQSLQNFSLICSEWNSAVSVGPVWPALLRYRFDPVLTDYDRHLTGTDARDRLWQLYHFVTSSRTDAFGDVSTLPDESDSEDRANAYTTRLYDALRVRLQDSNAHFMTVMNGGGGILNVAPDFLYGSPIQFVKLRESGDQYYEMSQTFVLSRQLYSTLENLSPEEELPPLDDLYLVSINPSFHAPKPRWQKIPLTTFTIVQADGDNDDDGDHIQKIVQSRLLGMARDGLFSTPNGTFFLSVIRSLIFLSPRMIEGEVWVSLHLPGLPLVVTDPECNYGDYVSSHDPPEVEEYPLRSFPERLDGELIVFLREFEYDIRMSCSDSCGGIDDRRGRGELMLSENGFCLEMHAEYHREALGIQYS